MRRAELDRLYRALDALRSRLGGYRRLAECQGRMGWPRRGVYFFFEEGELREDGRTPRVVRVGTHAVSVGSSTTLWSRLSQHRGRTAGSLPGGGNHRGSVFRLHVGTALQRAHPERYVEARATWGRGNTADAATLLAEHGLERDVSAHIGRMPFLWVEVDDEPGPTSRRAAIERSTVALLSNQGKPPLDAPSPVWLGHHADRAAVRVSGLWNVNYVDGAFNPAGLSLLEAAVAAR